ncbi:hypothetical protein L914_03728 [Phytophthora nicotianae]|uniref:Uncharacterized protein n=1 Tax=Phytophthora nicotianae TaxID=4792 RepID=W2NVG7_PHYNI|nr:hypothetical protein L914_03728 [Phytophthora nicotianae]
MRRAPTPCEASQLLTGHTTLRGPPPVSRSSHDLPSTVANFKWVGPLTYEPASSHFPRFCSLQLSTFVASVVLAILDLSTVIAICPLYTPRS